MHHEVNLSKPIRHITQPNPPERPMDMAPPRSPPALNDDVTEAILLRVAPDKPAHLFHASRVCTLWRRIISDPGFLHRYRAFHHRAPLLGFFYNNEFSDIEFDFPSPFSRFVAATAASPLRQAAHDEDDDRRRVSCALDCRHGRVLFRLAHSSGLAVWDPIADDWTELPPPGIQYAFYAAVVLCDVAGCDHRDCRGGRFLVVCIGYDARTRVYACVYSSEDGAWQTPVSDGTRCWRMDLNRPALIGDAIYCTVGCYSILKYDLVKRRFARIINIPDLFGQEWHYGDKRFPELMQNEDGSLGIAGVRASRLYLWSTRLDNPDEGHAAGWVRRKVIKLKKLLPLNKKGTDADLIGFAEGVCVLLINTHAGVFTLDLKSRRVMKVSNKPSKKYHNAVPFHSFFTPDRAS